MDNNDRRQRHNVPRHPSHPGALQSQAQYPVVGATDRFRQAPQAAAAQTPTSAPQGSRIPSQSYYAYQGHPQYAASNVQPSYGAQEYGAETPQRAAPYAQYGMYNVPGAQAAASGQSQYDPVQPYQQGRDSGAIEVLNSGFGSVPQAAAQYYMPGQEGPAGTAAAAMPTQSVPSQYSSLAYTGQQAPAERESMTPQYSAAGMTDSRQAPSQEQEYPPSYRAKSGEHEEFYTTFNNLLKTSNEHSSKGRCREAAETLIQVSDWLFQWAESVGLADDNEAQYEQKLKVWKDFNTSWLVALQKQKSLMEDMINTGQRPQPPQSLIDGGTLQKMGDNLTENCNKLEKHGLVDYEMGVWEEEIIAMIMKCQDLWGKVNDGAGSSQRAPGQPSSKRRL